ncbi:rhomboid family protein [Chitinophaga flava]|uniref:Rhomboid family intramembrane serine protease n=1 Tax=Chitinophaga flava TaxID=2259036 RepID=A0A365Y464_9BACT|nr:rhomboid family intramembrane serine protease [Chitinophaga flava]RBL92784.1 rhomboid family intramembrane serine protease [Chitinophaga flava]
MNDIGIVTLVLILLNLVVSYKGFKNTAFYYNHSFIVDEILIHKEYGRLVTSGFLHTSWMHLIFNMMSLCFFSGAVEVVLGIKYFLFIYMTSMVGGNLLLLFVHRHHGDYSAVGASGAVCGIIFASIALFPGMDISFFGIPLYIPGWIYGAGYTLYTIMKIKSDDDSTAHEAHLGGAFIGLLFAICLHPEVVKENYLPLLAMTLPCLVFLYVLFRKPHVLLTDNNAAKHYRNVDDLYNQQRTIQQQEIDTILEKIHHNGISSLSEEERLKLQQYAER